MAATPKPSTLLRQHLAQARMRSVALAQMDR